MPAVDKLFDASGEADIRRKNAYVRPVEDLTEDDMSDDIHEDSPDEDYEDGKFASMAIPVKVRASIDIDHAPAATNATGRSLRQQLVGEQVQDPAPTSGFLRRLFGR